MCSQVAIKNDITILVLNNIYILASNSSCIIIFKGDTIQLIDKHENSIFGKFYGITDNNIIIDNSLYNLNTLNVIRKYKKFKIRGLYGYS